MPVNNGRINYFVFDDLRKIIDLKSTLNIFPNVKVLCNNCVGTAATCSNESVKSATATIRYYKIEKRTLDVEYLSEAKNGTSKDITIDNFTLAPIEDSAEKTSMELTLNRYANSKGYVKAKILLTHGEKCGDRVRIPTCYGEVVEGIITEMTLHFGAIQTFADIVVTEWGNSETTE